MGLKFQKESNVPNISAATRMPHPKGAATAFSLDVVRQKTLTGEMSAVIRDRPILQNFGYHSRQLCKLLLYVRIDALNVYKCALDELALPNAESF